MKTKILILSLIVFSYYSCNSNNNKKQVSVVDNDGDTVQEGKLPIYDSEGYKLMKQKCFICHFEKPDPSKRESMIAPPMLRIQEHYKPSYPTKDEFVEAIVSWVNNPLESNTLMPGTIRKFNLMPKLHYEEADLILISETLYDMDFGDMPKMKMNKKNGLQLNNGKKWKLKQNSINQVDEIIVQLSSFKSDEVFAYQQLGKSVFDNAKTILLDDSYSGELFDQIHYFFSSIEGNIHMLIASNSIDDARKQQSILINKFGKFNNYFE